MLRRTALTATASLAAVVSSSLFSVGPAGAEAIVYETQDVRAVRPGEPVVSAEHAAIQIPTGYTRHKTSWHRWSWVENDGMPVTIGLDLEPRRDTVKELRAERARFAERFADSYRELDFTVNGKDARVRARWVFTHEEPATGNVEPFTSVVLMRGGNRILVAGTVSERDLAKRIRRHVVRTISFPS